MLQNYFIILLAYLFSHPDSSSPSPQQRYSNRFFVSFWWISLNYFSKSYPFFKIRFTVNKAICLRLLETISFSTMWVELMFSSFYINSSSKSWTSSQKIELTRKSFSLLTHPALRLKILHSYRLGAKLHYANAMKVISMHFGTHFIRRYSKLHGVKLNKVVLSLTPSSAHQA